MKIYDRKYGYAYKGLIRRHKRKWEINAPPHRQPNPETQYGRKNRSFYVFTISIYG
jgi:hypothetical protein